VRGGTFVSSSIFSSFIGAAPEALEAYAGPRSPVAMAKTGEPTWSSSQAVDFVSQRSAPRTSEAEELRPRFALDVARLSNQLMGRFSMSPRGLL
jgi:hypothetical protein